MVKNKGTQKKCKKKPQRPKQQMHISILSLCSRVTRNLLCGSLGQILILLQFFLKNLLIFWMNGGRVGVDFVGVRIDQVDGHPQIMLRQQLVLVGSLQRSGIVLDEPRLLEGVGDEFGFEGDVGESVAVFDATKQVGFFLGIGGRLPRGGGAGGRGGGLRLPPARQHRRRHRFVSLSLSSASTATFSQFKSVLFYQ